MGNVVTPLWQEAPAATRHFIVVYPVLSLATTVLGISQLIICVPFLIFRYFFVQTFLISCFVRQFDNGFAFLTILLEMYMAFSSFTPKEKELGSSGFLWWMMYANFLKNIVFVALSLLVSLAFPMYLAFPSEGIWSLIIMQIAISSAENPETEINIFGFHLKYKFYPFLLVGLLSLMSQIIPIDLIAAVAIGLVYKRFKLDRFHLNRGCAEKFDRIWGCCRIWQHGGQWLAPHGAIIAEGGGYNNVQTSFIRTFSDPTTAFDPPADSNFKVFSGHGHRLGDADGTARELPMQKHEQGPSIIEV
eukprot:GEMP01041430.1.p1 GENE.GEMP01041430.1~~GEMP01041430.1.p1  ORF type:complete len:303 (+),score=37.90 GEMP01041430.1:108-1016(+)